MRTMRCLAAVGVTLWLYATRVAASLPGPTLILQCPDSPAVVSLLTMTSGNSFGGRRWSDGEASYPMVLKSPMITRCGVAGRFFWVADAQVLGKVGFMGDDTFPDLWYTAREIRFLTEEEYLDALAAGLGSTPDRERCLRLLAWRAGNDCSRPQPASFAGPKPPGPCRTPTFPMGSRARENLELLEGGFHPKDDNERIMQIEMLRELGRFEEAGELLSASFPQSYDEVIRQMQEHVDLRDEQVFMMMGQMPSPRFSPPRSSRP